MNDEVSAVGIAVAVPATVGPLPMEESLDQLVGPLVGQSEADDRPQSVALLGAASPVAGPR